MRKSQTRLLWSAVLLTAVVPLGRAQACTIIWDESAAVRRSDAVVWGRYVPSGKQGFGTIEVTRREKGPKARSLPVTWDVEWIDDGADCPVWQPNAQYPRGRFFLRKTANGTFTIDAQTPAKRAKR